MSSLKLCAISYGICWNLRGNATNFYFIKRKLDFDMQIFAVSEVSGGSHYNCNTNNGIETDATKLIFIWQPVTT